MHERIASRPALCALLALAMAHGCSRPSADDDRPVVVVSVPPQAFFVEQLANDRVSVEVLLPPGSSPHTHEPSMGQMRAIENADLYVKVGHPAFPFEHTWLDRILDNRPELRVVDCSRGVDTDTEDPHVWVSPRIVRQFVPRIASALIEILADRAEEIRSREQELLAEVAHLDAEIRDTLRDADSRTFWVYHPAWGYLARDYGLQQVAIEIGARQPDPHRLTSLIERAQEERVRVIFVQPQFSQRAAELIANEIGGRVVAVDPLARDWLENMRRVARAFREALSE